MQLYMPFLASLISTFPDNGFLVFSNHLLVVTYSFPSGFISTASDRSITSLIRSSHFSLLSVDHETTGDVKLSILG